MIALFSVSFLLTFPFSSHSTHYTSFRFEFIYSLEEKKGENQNPPQKQGMKYSCYRSRRGKIHSIFQLLFSLTHKNHLTILVHREIHARLKLHLFCTFANQKVRAFSLYLIAKYQTAEEEREMCHSVPRALGTNFLSPFHDLLYSDPFEIQCHSKQPVF